jgi:hypothetical protein
MPTQPIAMLVARDLASKDDRITRSDVSETPAFISSQIPGAIRPPTAANTLIPREIK